MYIGRTCILFEVYAGLVQPNVSVYPPTVHTQVYIHACISSYVCTATVPTVRTYICTYSSTYVCTVVVHTYELMRVCMRLSMCALIK